MDAQAVTQKNSMIGQETREKATITPEMAEMFGVGAHYGYSRTKRHPSAEEYIFGHKNKVDIFDLEKTIPLFERAKKYMEELGAKGSVVLLVGGKQEVSNSIKQAAEATGMPFVSGRWLGGTITNFSIIRSRVDRVLQLKESKVKGELEKYTKRERLKIDEEIVRLDDLFSGLVRLTKIPDVIFIVDPKEESTAVNEAKRKKIPIVALANSDCDIKSLDYPIVGNDASRNSIEYFVSRIAEAYNSGKKKGLAKSEPVVSVPDKKAE